MSWGAAVFLLTSWLTCVCPNFLKRVVPKAAKYVMCLRFSTNSILKYAKSHFSTNSLTFLYAYYIAKIHLPFIQEYIV